MNEAWIKDIMTQKFLNSDLSRLLMLRAFTAEETICDIYRKARILEYMYRIYSDYPETRSINPDARIRNIHRYGISDVKYILDKALEEWKGYAANEILVFDDRYIYLKDVGEDKKELGKITRQVCDMLATKYFSIHLQEPMKLDENECAQDTDTEIFGVGLYRNRVFEDIQYCPLCEEVQIEKLRAVHILPARFCESSVEYLDKNNGMIFCKEHAEDYISGKFLFNEMGFVSNINSSIVDDKMHLAIHVKKRQRREYIIKYMKVIDERRGACK